MYGSRIQPCLMYSARSCDFSPASIWIRDIAGSTPAGGSEARVSKQAITKRTERQIRIAAGRNEQKETKETKGRLEGEWAGLVVCRSALSFLSFLNGVCKGSGECKC